MKMKLSELLYRLNQNSAHTRNDPEVEADVKLLPESVRTARPDDIPTRFYINGVSRLGNRIILEIIED